MIEKMKEEEKREGEVVVEKDMILEDFEGVKSGE